MKRFRVWGEFGPTAHDYIVWFGRAKSPENAVKRAVKEFKKRSEWSKIGMSNVHVDIAVDKAKNTK